MSSVILLVAWGTIPLGSISAGFLLEGIGAVETMLVLAGVMLTVAIGATLTRSVREVPPIAALRSSSATR